MADSTMALAVGLIRAQIDSSFTTTLGRAVGLVRNAGRDMSAALGVGLLSGSLVSTVASGLREAVSSFARQEASSLRLRAVVDLTGQGLGAAEGIEAASRSVAALGRQTSAEFQDSVSNGMLSGLNAQQAKVVAAVAGPLGPVIGNRAEQAARFLKEALLGDFTALDKQGLGTELAADVQGKLEILKPKLKMIIEADAASLAGVDGSLRRLTAASDSLRVSIGQALGPAFSGLVDKASAAMSLLGRAVADLSDEAKANIVNYGSLGVAIAGVAVAATPLIPALSAVAGVLGSVTTAVLGLSGSLLGLLARNPMLTLAAGAAAAAFAFSDLSPEVRKSLVYVGVFTAVVTVLPGAIAAARSAITALRLTWVALAASVRAATVAMASNPATAAAVGIAATGAAVLVANADFEELLGTLGRVGEEFGDLVKEKTGFDPEALVKGIADIPETVLGAFRGVSERLNEEEERLAAARESAKREALAGVDALTAAEDKAARKRQQHMRQQHMMDAQSIYKMLALSQIESESGIVYGKAGKFRQLVAGQAEDDRIIAAINAELSQRASRKQQVEDPNLNGIVKNVSDTVSRMAQDLFLFGPGQ